MKKHLSWLLVLVMLLSSTVVPAFALDYGEEWEGNTTVQQGDYKDVTPEHWAFENIQRVSDKKWFGGYPDGTFRPENSITRAEALKVFSVFLGLEVLPVSSTSYYDVDPGEWYAPYIEAGKELLPVRTSIQGKVPFQPDMPITREDAMYALVKALGYDSGVDVIDQSVLNMFSDKNSISSNVKAYVAVAVSNGLVSGNPDGTIGAQDPLTRAEFATLLYRASFIGFNTEREAKLQFVKITPNVKQELTVGESFIISAEATYSDKTTKEYTNINPYNFDDNDVVSVNKNKITALKAGVCVIRFNDEYLKNESIVVIVTEDSAPDNKDEEKGDEPSVTPDDKDEEKGDEPSITPDDKDEEKGDGPSVTPDDKDENGTDPSVANGDNWSFKNAIEMDINDSVKGSINFSIDEDVVERLQQRWYKIEVPEASVVTLTYLSETMSSKLHIFSKDGSNSIDGVAVAAKSSKSFSYNLLKGTYYIKVERSKDYGEFSLTLNTLVYPEETNGWTMETAIEVDDGFEFKSADNLPDRVYYNDNCELVKTLWYKATMPEYGVLCIGNGYQGNVSSRLAEVYDINGNEIGEARTTLSYNALTEKGTQRYIKVTLDASLYTQYVPKYNSDHVSTLNFATTGYNKWTAETVKAKAGVNTYGPVRTVKTKESETDGSYGGYWYTFTLNDSEKVSYDVNYSNVTFYKDDEKLGVLKPNTYYELEAGTYYMYVSHVYNRNQPVTLKLTVGVF